MSERICASRLPKAVPARIRPGLNLRCTRFAVELEGIIAMVRSNTGATIRGVPNMPERMLGDHADGELNQTGFAKTIP